MPPFLRTLYAPGFGLGFIGLALALVGYAQASLGWLPVLLLAAIALSFLAEA